MQINLNPTSERGASRDAVNRPRETLGDSHLISSDPRSRFGLVCDLLCCRGNSRRELDKFWSKWSKVLPVRVGRAATIGDTPAPQADRPELMAAPSGNGTAAIEAPTNGYDIEAPAAAPENWTSETTHPGPPVALNGPDEEVIVWGKPMGVLPDAEYPVVKALVDAYALEQPLSMSELRNRSKDARGNAVEDPVVF